MSSKYNPLPNTGFKFTGIVRMCSGQNEKSYEHCTKLRVDWGGMVWGGGGGGWNGQKSNADYFNNNTTSKIEKETIEATEFQKCGEIRRVKLK